VTGGSTPANLPARCQTGFFVEPTVVTGLSMGCRTNQEEIFGPVVTVTPFQSTTRRLALANQSPYGLAASVLDPVLSRAHSGRGTIQCGTIWINCWLFRDLRSRSADAPERSRSRSGDEAIRFFTEPKNVCLKL